MPTYRCEVYLELITNPSALTSPLDEISAEIVVMFQRIELPFVPVPHLELDFGVPAEHGGVSETSLQTTIRSASYHVATDRFTVRCRPAREFAQAQLEMDNEQTRDQVITDCTTCGFWPVPAFE